MAKNNYIPRDVFLVWYTVSVFEGNNMAQITITIPDNLDTALRTIAEIEGIPFSQVATNCLSMGFSPYVEGLNKYQVYLKLLRTSRAGSQENTNE